MKKKIIKLRKDKFTEIKKSKKDYFGALKGIGRFTRRDRMEDRV